jgi:methyl-accepting chemotaxis protein
LQEIKKNFRTIITEVRESSEQVAASSKELTAITAQSVVAIEGVTKTAGDISERASKQAYSTEEGSLKTDQLGKAIRSNLEDVKELNAVASEVFLAVSEGLDEIGRLLNSTNESDQENEILKTMENLTAIAQNNLASTQETTSAMEEQTVSLEEIADASDGLASLAQNLYDIINRFKL